MITVIRTQVQLTATQAESLRRIAARRGVSMASLVRSAVDELLLGEDLETRWERAMSVVGKFRDRDGATDVSERHDEYFVEAILSDERLRR